MGFFKKLFGGAAVAGTAVATAKVVERVRENNPGGVGDVNQDGRVDYKDYVEETKKAAAELYGETSDKVKEAGMKEAVIKMPILLHFRTIAESAVLTDVCSLVGCTCEGRGAESV